MYVNVGRKNMWNRIRHIAIMLFITTSTIFSTGYKYDLWKLLCYKMNTGKIQFLRGAQ